MSKAGVPIKSEGLLWYTINWPWPGIHNGESLGKSKKSVIKEAKRPDSGAMTGQKMAEGQLGTIRVPRARNAHMCLNVGIINETGGHSQLLSLDQSWEKESVASASAHQKRELNLNSCVLELEANRSIVKGPHFSFNMWNIRGFSCQSSKSTVLLNASAT